LIAAQLGHEALMKGSSESGAGKAAGASERILRTLAAEFPRLHDRQSFLDSPALKAWYEKEDEALSDNERQAVARARFGLRLFDGRVFECFHWAREATRAQANDAAARDQRRR